jgi:hypothetical protein
MRLYVVRVYFRGVKLSEREVRREEGVLGDVRIQIVQQPDGRSVREAICMALTTQCLPRLLEPQLVGISTQALGLEGFEEVKNADGIVYYRQGWWCRVK